LPEEGLGIFMIGHPLSPREKKLVLRWKKRAIKTLIKIGMPDDMWMFVYILYKQISAKFPREYLEK
jgi:hypothetical protein